MKKKSKNPINIKNIIVFFTIFFVIFSTISIIYLKINYDKSFARVNNPNPIFSAYLRYSDVPEYSRTDVEFNSGKNTLKGHIYGEANSKGLIIISHGLGYGSENYLAETIHFVENGWRVFTFDNTGTHNSEGESTVGPSQSLLDLKSALDFINGEQTLKSLPIALYGHSWGAYAVTSILNYNYDIDAVVSISGFNTPMELLSEQVNTQLGIFSPLMSPFLWLYQKILFNDYFQISAVDGINNSTSGVLIIHGDHDEAISYEGASIISHKSEITNPNVSFITRSIEYQNGHNSLFESIKAINYIKIKNNEYLELYNDYSGNIPDSVKIKYYESINRFMTSELDKDFMNTINQFFNSQIGK